jgi:probable HAF family extracellular repeat protein
MEATMRRFSILLLIVFPCLVAAPLRLSAQRLPHYTVIDLGTLGGTFSETGLFRPLAGGWLTGDSTLPNDTADHAFLWHRGRMRDLGTLGGPNSFGWGVNDSGNAVGGADSSATDPLQEQFCFSGDNSICLPFLWRNDIRKMIALPTLGGTNGAASGINNADEVVGQAENAKTDQTCVGTGSSQVLQLEPALWRKGKVHQLALAPGDADGAAFAINDWGQAVGTTFLGYCAAPEHAVLWQNGTAVDLGNLGGANANEAHGINNWGQVVGVSDLAGDTTHHAFLWQWGVMADLGTLSDDVMSSAWGINNWAQVVGNSVDAHDNSRGFLWQWGVMTDLNTLIPSDSPLYLLTANGINDWGQIVGIAWQWNMSEEHAYLATPTWYAGENAASAAPRENTQRPFVTLPENIRKLQQRRGPLGLFKGGLIQPQ